MDHRSSVYLCHSLSFGKLKPVQNGPKVGQIKFVPVKAGSNMAIFKYCPRPMSHNRTFYELFMELKIELSEFGTLNLRFKLVQRHLVTRLFTN